MNKLTVSPEFLLWSELCVLWAIAAYGISSDPLPEEATGNNFRWRNWKIILGIRGVGAGLVTFAISGSLILSIWMLLIILLLPWLRFKSSSRRTTEVETSVLVFNIFATHILIRHWHLTLRHSIPTTLTAEQLSAISIMGATMLFVVRGGTYIVRGCLRKAGTLPIEPHKVAEDGTRESDLTLPKLPVPQVEGDPPSAATDSENQIDTQEINRGRLIGNIERLLLTIVVAAGSYAALAFLIAAKGLIRSNDLRERDFAEYFLVGSLSSVLVALCAGIALRFALLALWPALLSLQMQGS
jgi:hypothetical protein